MVAVVSEAVIVGVQLGAVGDVRTVVSGVLVTVSVPAATEEQQDEYFSLVVMVSAT